MTGAISRQEASKDVHACILSNKTLYLLDVLQKLPIDKMNSLNIHQEIIDEMSDIILMLYREYAGMVF
ncbi:DNA recombination and repair protein RecO [Staphylococcus aureus]|nr:DNA recombination and repair protein RecO [Staphylococcus aureus]